MVAQINKTTDAALLMHSKLELLAATLVAEYAWEVFCQDISKRIFLGFATVHDCECRGKWKKEEAHLQPLIDWARAASGHALVSALNLASNGRRVGKGCCGRRRHFVCRSCREELGACSWFRIESVR